MRLTPPGPNSPADSDRDAGLTLVELLVAMGIFLIIMGIVSTAIVTGFRTIRDVNDLSDVQAQQQNALLWMTRLLRYADNPSEGATPAPWVPFGQATVDAAGNGRLTFYTYSGTGPIDRVPYKAELYVDPSGDLVSRVTTPTSVAGYGYCWLRSDNTACSAITEDVRTRVLVNATADHSPAMRLVYRMQDGTETNQGVGSDLATWRTWASSVAEVTLQISDDARTQQVEQTVGLVNPR